MEDSFARVKKKNRGSLIAFLIILFASLVAGGVLINPFLQALIAGSILTLMMQPLHDFLVKQRFMPRLAAALATTAVVLVVVGPFSIFVVMAVRQFVKVSQAFMLMERLTLEEYLTKLSNWGPVHYFSLNPVELGSHLGEVLQHVGTVASNFVLEFAQGVPGGVLQVLLACLTCYFLLTDGHKFSAWVFGKIPMDQEIRSRMTAAFHDTAISVVWASMAASMAQAVLMMAAFLVLGLPNVFLVGGATFVLAWIPIFGSSPIWLSAAGYLYWQGSPGKALTMLAFGVAVGTVDNFVRPLVLKGRGEMHPLVSLVAIFGGLQWFGFFGVFLGPILAAVVISLLEIWPVVGRPFGLIFSAAPIEAPAPHQSSKEL